MIFKSHVFDEPLLEFGEGGQHCDPRQGLREFGPLQPRFVRTSLARISTTCMADQPQ
jgi:hypothetical protein